MWQLAMMLGISAVIALIEVPSLIRKSLKKELWVFSVLLVFGTGLSIAEVHELDIPNPLDWIAFVYKPLSDLIFGMLK